MPGESSSGLASLPSLMPTLEPYVRYVDTIPSVEELHDLYAELEVLKGHADEQLAALLNERGKTPTGATNLAGVASNVYIKKENDDALRVSESVKDRRDSVSKRTTDAEAANKRTRLLHSPKSERDSDEEAGSEEFRSEEPVSQPSALGWKLKMRASEPRKSHDAPIDPASCAFKFENEIFTDNTTFSWDLPVNVDQSVLPQCEPVEPPPPYPSHPLDVHENFADKDWRDREVPIKEAGRGRQSKETSQVPSSTFFNYAEAFFKPITEDDLAWLSSKNDDGFPFQFPELGTHYKKVWEKEDAELMGMLQGDSASKWTRPTPGKDQADRDANASNSRSSLSLSELNDAHMYDRQFKGGALLERLASVLLLPKNVSSERRKGSPVQRLSPPPDTYEPFFEMEAEACQECEAIGLLDASVVGQRHESSDGPIASALRLAQSRLRAEMRANDQRKARLFKVAQDRMAYQDYQACLAAADREIEAAWTKRMRQIKASMGKKRKGAPDDLGPTKPQLAETLPDTLERREKMRAGFEPMFDRIPHAREPARDSIYQGIE
ncbi:Transcriptional regulator [Malassezia yamatoensis]|uniref:Transcriptional regulator n=1 Tax=Malassezia yamatoensis TaxID=253288 RepID=A0AAJ5YTC6_9BASI|nr:Transcriptional regulator [Malassezia yamatoensis]